MADRSRPFDRLTLEEAFGRLGRIAKDAGKVIDISIYGGSALILATDFRVATRDVDAVFESDRPFIRAAAAVVAAEFGWDDTWINDGVKGFLSTRDGEAEAKTMFRSYPSEDLPGLRVFVATPSYMFAMKCLAMRVGGGEESADIADIRNLGKLLGIVSSEQALRVISRYYPSAVLPPKTRFGVEEIFDGGADET